MKLSTKARYGVRAMVDLAAHTSEGPVFLKDIARRQAVSYRYLDHIVSALRAAGLVRGAKVRRGGYLLARHASEISVYDVVSGVEGSFCPVACVDNPSVCERSGFCPTIDVWEELRRSMVEVLESVTLADLVHEHDRREEQPSAPL